MHQRLDERMDEGLSTDEDVLVHMHPGLGRKLAGADGQGWRQGPLVRWHRISGASSSELEI